MKHILVQTCTREQSCYHRLSPMVAVELRPYEQGAINTVFLQVTRKKYMYFPSPHFEDVFL